MIKVIKSVIAVCFLSIVFVSCTIDKRDSRNTMGEPSFTNLQKWHDAFNIRKAEPGEKLATNDTRPSNVSPDLALTKALQALANSSLKTESGVPYNTIYTVVSMNDARDPDNGRYIYIGLLEFDKKKSNGYTISALKGIGPGVVVVDALDESRPAIVRTKNSLGEPYKLKVHLESHAATMFDDNHVYKVAEKNGFSNIIDFNNEVSTPKIEVDQDWNICISTTYLKNDAPGAERGTFYYPVAYLNINASTGKVIPYAMDNPITKDVNEGENPKKKGWKKQSEIPEWVSWVGSEYLFIQDATYNGLDYDNYGKRTIMNDLVLDGSDLNDLGKWQPTEFSSAIVDISMSRDGKDFILVGYRTSRSNDMSINSIVTYNARTLEAVEHEIGPNSIFSGMTTKSFVIQQVEGAGLMRGSYFVQDLTLHVIFGTPTWEGILVRDALDNDNKSSTKTLIGDVAVFMSRPLSYATYAGTVWIEANNDMNTDDIVWDVNYQTSMTKYKNNLYRQHSRRGLSTVLKDSKIKGTVVSVCNFGESIVVRLKTSNLDFIAEPKNVYDPDVGDAIGLNPGDIVYMKYGDQVNSDKVPVRLLKRIK